MKCKWNLTNFRRINENSGSLRPLKLKVNETFSYAITKYLSRWNFRAADDPRVEFFCCWNINQRVALLLK